MTHHLPICARVGDRSTPIIRRSPATKSTGLVYFQSLDALQLTLEGSCIARVRRVKGVEMHAATQRPIAATMLVTACVLANSEVAYSQPAPPARRLPGVTKGEVRTWWLAPYVRVTEERIAKRWTIDVRWFDSEGNVVREVSGRNVSAHSGYVSVIADGKNTIHAVNGDWKFVLPKKSDSLKPF